MSGKDSKKDSNAPVSGENGGKDGFPSPLRHWRDVDNEGQTAMTLPDAAVKTEIRMILFFLIHV